MKNGFLRLASVILIFVLPQQIVPADVAPPGAVVAISLIALIGLGLLVTVIVIVSFLVIRAIRKNRTRKDDA